MRKILTVSLKPALDSGGEVPEVDPEVKLRCTNPTLEPGGGGVNVSRAVRILGGDSTAFVALGGATGNMMAELLENEAVSFIRFPIPGLTPQSFAVTETSSGRQYRFTLPGPEWSKDQGARALAKIIPLIEKDMLVVASGSLPPGVEHDFYVRLGVQVANAGAQMVVDTSGAAQTEILEKGKGLVHVLRMDRHESELLAGKPLTNLQEAADFAQMIARKEHAMLVIMGRGADGSIFATEDRRFHWVSPKGKIVSKVGAGDSFVGGLTLGLANGMSLEDAGRQATAAASSAVMTPGSQLCRKEVVEQLIPQTVFTAL